jgi:kynurenine formamidase
MGATVAHRVPSDEEVLGYIDELSNWGRWGEGDERGTLNYLTPAVRRRAVAQVREGRALSLGRDMRPTPPHQPGPDDIFGPIQRFMLMTGQGLSDEHRVMTGAPGARSGATLEYIGFVFHGYDITHMDALSHLYWDGKMYGGAPAEHVNSMSGATSLAVTAMREGIMTKGVLIDAPLLRGVDWLDAGDGVFPEDLEQAEAQLGVTIGEGDAVILRTGYLRRKKEKGSAADGKPGWHAASMPFLHERKISLIGSDVDLDVKPSGYSWTSHPCHIITLTAMGLPILDATNLEELASTCAELGRYEFLLTINPLRIEGGTGSPVNPIATF